MERLLDLDEVAEYLRVTPATLRFLRHKGTAPLAIKVGRRLVWRESEVEAFIARQTVSAAS